jgi:hypothetical protein
VRIVLGLLMSLNTALFVFGAIQHVGVEIGRFHEPVIVPAAIVESVCAVSLLWGLWALFRGSPAFGRIVFTGNLIALAGVQFRQKVRVYKHRCQNLPESLHRTA